MPGAGSKIGSGLGTRLVIRMWPEKKGDIRRDENLETPQIIQFPVGLEIPARLLRP